MICSRDRPHRAGDGPRPEHPGRLWPGPYLLTGVSAEVSRIKLVTSRVGSPGTFHLRSLPCGHSRA